MTKNRWRLLILGLFIVAGMTLTGGVRFNSRDMVYISAHWSEDNVEIGPGQVGVITDSWVTCSKGLTQDWLDALETTYVLTRNGMVIQEITPKKAAKLWSDPAIHQENPPMCMWPAAHLWVTRFYARLHTDEAGVYELHAYKYLSEPVTDGWEWPPGSLNWMEGVRLDRTILLHVER
ncbi:MAG: hypothetical protein PVF70_09235 [Anaerolineales bacterium]|jgi:hypothetical protein